MLPMAIPNVEILTVRLLAAVVSISATPRIIIVGRRLSSNTNSWPRHCAAYTAAAAAGFSDSARLQETFLIYGRRGMYQQYTPINPTTTYSY